MLISSTDSRGGEYTFEAEGERSLRAGEWGWGFTSMRRIFAVALAGFMLAACEAAAPGVTSEQAATAKPAESSASAPPAASAAASEPKTVADIFPPGEGRDRVLNSCGNCHNVACTAIGQRNAQRWDSLRDGHKEHMQGADLNVIFAYLKENFDDRKPAPNVPPRFLEGGCTPF